MEYDADKILEKAIERFNYENDTSLPYDKKLSLLGTQSAIDSLRLVQLIIVIEEEIENTTGQAISLVNEKAMSLNNSPFRSIQSLAEYIGEMIKNGK